MASTIIGATTLAQLQEDIDAFQVSLSKEVPDAIEAIHSGTRNPGQ